MKMMARSIVARTRAAVLPVMAATLLATGCQQEQSETVQVADLLATVPADTPYLAVNMKYLPDDVFEHQMRLFAPRIVTLLEALQEVAGSDPDLKAEDTQRVSALLDAAIAYLGDEDEWEQHLGVLYGEGFFPVIRLALQDPAESLAKLNQLHADMGVEPQRATQLGEHVYQVPVGHAQLSAYYGIVDGYFIATAMPDGADAELKSSFGLSAPASTYSMTTLEMLADSRGYSTGVMGFVDSLKLFDSMMTEESSFSQWLSELERGHDEIVISDMSPECRAELRSLAGIVPGMDWGASRIDKTGFATSSMIQLRTDIAAGLVEMTGDVQGLKDDPGSDLAFGLSFRVGPMRDFIMQMARNIETAPFECETLWSLNDSASQVLAQSGSPLPPFVGQIRGLKVQMDDFAGQIESMQPPKMSAALFVENAQLLMSMAGLFIPGLAEMELPSDGTPVRMDEAVSGMLPNASDEAVFAALTDSAIGVALGEAQGQALPDLLQEKGGDEGVLFSYFLDYGALIEIQRKELEHLGDDYEVEITLDDEATEDSDPEARAEELARRKLSLQHSRTMLKAMFHVYEVLGRMGTWGEPSSEGLILGQTVNYKDT